MAYRGAVVDLLERSSVLNELSDVLAATAVGGRVALVAGEAGVGKSALVKRFTELLSADIRVLVGGCDPLLTPRARGPLHDVGRQTGGRLAALLTAGSPREQLFAAFLDELHHHQRQVVEDAHWADEVLGLLAEGLSDAEIAARLSLSAKTVGHHVSALLAKLGVPSRRHAARGRPSAWTRRRHI